MSEHRRSGRHTKPSEKNEINQNEINHMEETKYNRASAVPRNLDVAQFSQAYSENDEIPSGKTCWDQTQRSATHYHPSASYASAASMPELHASRDKLDEPRRRSVDNPPFGAITPKSTPIQSGDSGSSFGAPFGTQGASTGYGPSGSGKDEPGAQIPPAFSYLELQEASKDPLLKYWYYLNPSAHVADYLRGESGQLLDSETTIADNIEGGFLGELEGVAPTGTLRYKPRPSPWKGEGMGSLLETFPHGDGDSTIKPLDEKMIEDVFKVVEALGSGFLDTQADAATAIASLTSDAEFRELLSDPKAEKVAKALCHASSRLLVETKYRPARRQSAVIVANPSNAQALGRFVLDSDPPLETGKPGIVDSLVTLAMLTKLSRSSSFDMRSLLETVPQGDDNSTIEPLDEEMIEDVFKPVEMLQSDVLDTQPDAATAVAGLTSDEVAESSAAITSASSFTAPPPHDPQGSVSEISDDRSQAAEDELIEQNTGNDNPMPEFGVSRGSRRLIWDYLCQSTGQAATSHYTLAVTIFCSATVTGIAEGNDPLWISSLSVVVLLFAVTSVAFCLALPEVARNSRVTSEEPPV